ncbi:MAG TPA: GNAT family N-acetyltransferase [Aquifex aeolicus]|uniref:GNAT family N-acetyltransferase n=1 Tax=Aquifex aeolicus TaxID=63363 RepID=A0A9D0YP87_AQUAO|nr:GNAT family N-acetyltransferase [Aquificales bacterium]HIP98146.1 GNAT family N-acetyltransferase [Aquifex aeolicus]HIQ26553.1 GNAT family N-acetyltransferase [Aquifex aeolicus]
MPRVERWFQMEDFENFFPMLKDMLKAIYGDAQKGLKIYQERYDAINYYKNYRATPNSFLLVAKEGEKPIGFLYARRKRNHTYLYDIYVKPEYRKKGVARKLVETLEKLAGKPIRADTHEKAIPAFRKLGFKVLKEYSEDGIRWFLVERD